MRIFNTARIVLLLSPILLGESAKTAPVDLSPPLNSMGYADENGHFRMVQRFGDIKFSNDFIIPLRFEFWTGSENLKSPSPFGWNGWFCGPLESTAQMYGGDRFLRVDLLCAKRMFLERSEDAPNLYVSADGAWTATVKDDLISVARGDGWRLRFQKGKVLDLRTDSDVLIHWRRDDAGRVVAIAEEGNPESGLIVNWGEGENARVESLDLPGKSVSLSTKNTGPAFLHYESQFSWDLKSGKKKTIRFRHLGDSLDIVESKGYVRRFEWDPETGHLVSDGMNRYGVKAAAEAGGVPTISLTTSTGKTVSRKADQKNGVAEVVDEHGQSWRIKRGTKGAAFNQVTSIERLEESGEAKLMMRNEYNEKGHLVRREWRGIPDTESRLTIPKLYHPRADLLYFDEEISTEGDMKNFEYTYDENGNHLQTLSEEKVVFQNEYDDQNRPTLIECPGRFRHRIEYGEGLAFEKWLTIEGVTDRPFGWIGLEDDYLGPYVIVRRRTNEKGDTLEQEHLDGSVKQFVYDDRERLRSDLLLAPDGRTEVKRSEYVYSGDGRKMLAIRENIQTQETAYEEFELDASGGVENSRKINPFVAKTFLSNQP